MGFRLVFERDGQQHERPLPGTSFRIGRELDNDLVIPDDSVSRHHARLDWKPPHWQVVDTHSTNRVRVNDLIIPAGEDGATVLEDGDGVVLGGFAFVLRRDEPDRLVLGDDEKPGETTGTFAVRDFAGLLDVPAEREQLTHEAREVVRRAKRVVEVVAAAGRRIGGARPLEEILQSIVDLVFETTTAERAALLLWEEPVAQLVPRILRGRRGATPEPFRVSRTVVQRAYDERCTVLLGPEVSPTKTMLGMGLRSAVAVPLWKEDGVIGVVYADAPQVAAFDPFSLDLLSALANYAAIAIEQARLLDRVRREERDKERLQRYHPRAVVDHILAASGSSKDLGLKPQEAEVTVLFCDMVDFTATAERLAPQEVMLLLNRYFSHMTEVIFEHEGTLDKYIGDCIMAVFGAPLAQPDHAARAARAALGLRQVTRRLMSSGPGGGMEFRIGISSGRVVSGDLGHAMRRDWTVLGATVNLAARMQSSVAKPGQIVLTEATRRGLGNEFEVRSLDVALRPKGISGDIRAFELIGARG
jgi:adenylate cyclase